MGGRVAESRCRSACSGGRARRILVGDRLDFVGFSSDFDLDLAGGEGQIRLKFFQVFQHPG